MELMAKFVRPPPRSRIELRSSQFFLFFLLREFNQHHQKQQQQQQQQAIKDHSKTSPSLDPTSS